MWSNGPLILDNPNLPIIHQTKNPTNVGLDVFKKGKSI
jgi:hypothetical protein